MNGGLNNPRVIDATPVNGNLTNGISSDWAYDHADDLDAHTKNLMEIIRIGDGYFVPPYDVNSTAGYDPADDWFMTSLLVVPRKMTFDRIAIEISTLDVGGNVRLGIYNNGINLYPGTLLLDAGTIDTTTTGVKTIVINQQLDKGIYHLAQIGDNNTYKYRAYQATITPLGATAASIASKSGGWRVAQAYGAFPDPFTAAGVLTSSPPIIGLRPSSLD